MLHKRKATCQNKEKMGRKNRKKHFSKIQSVNC